MHRTFWKPLFDIYIVPLSILTLFKKDKACFEQPVYDVYGNLFITTTKESDRAMWNTSSAKEQSWLRGCLRSLSKELQYDSEEVGSHKQAWSAVDADYILQYLKDWK